MINNKHIKWLRIAEKIGYEFSTCTRRKYGSIILSKDNRVVGIGYNGAPPNYQHCDNGGCPRALQSVPHGSQYDNCIAVHAEANALMYSDINLRYDGTLVVNGPPCYGCAKLIATSGIKRVVYKTDQAYGDFENVKSLLNGCGIMLHGYDTIDELGDI